MTRSTDFDATLVSADTDDLDAFVANGATRRRSLEGLLTTLSRQRNYLLSFNLQTGPPPSTVPALEETLTAIIETDRFVDDVSTALKDDGQTRGAGIYWQDLSFDLDQRNPDHELVALLVEQATIRAQELVDAHTHTTGGGRNRRTTIDLHDLATVLLYGPAESVPSPLLLEQLQATLGPDRFATLEQHLDEIAVHQQWANRTLTAAADGPISFNGDLASLDQQSQALLNESYRTVGGRNPTQRLDEPELAYQLQQIAEHDPARAIALKWALESSLTPNQQADIDRLLATGGRFGETIPLALRHPQQGAEGAAKSWWNQNFGWWTDTWADATTAITYGFAGMAYGQSPTASPELTPNIPRTWAQVDEIVELEFELDNLAQHGGADLATTIELASLAYGTAKGGITLTRIGTKYFLRSGDDIITELGPTTIRQLDNDHTPFAPLGRGSTVNNIDRFHPRTFREQLAIDPGGGLAAHEAAGGHALARHVGKSDADLLARLEAQPGITGASTFSSRAIAEAAVADVLSTNAGGIQSWLAGSGRRLVLNGRGSSTVGRYVAQGSTTVQNVYGVRVVLVRDSSLRFGYRVQTAFPTP